MRITVVLGVFEEDALKNGSVMTEESYRMLDDLGRRVQANISFVYAVPDEAWAGRKPGVKVWRSWRDRMLGDIKSQNPDMVYALGTLPLQALVNKGNATQKAFRRRKFFVEELGNIPCFTSFGLEQVWVKAGYAKWIGMDLVAAMKGQVQTTFPQYTVIKQGDEYWDKRPPELDNITRIGYDTETYPGFDPYHPKARLRMGQIGYAPGKVYVVQFTPDSQIPAWLVQILEDPDIKKYGSNIKFDYRWHARFGVILRNMYDTGTGEHVIDERNPQKDLKSITFTYAPHLGDYSREHHRMVDERGGWEFVEDWEQYDYAACDGEASLLAGVGQERELARRGLWHTYEKVSVPVYNLLARMEVNGMCVDYQRNRELDKLYNDKLLQLRKELTNELGPINPNSPVQIRDTLLRLVPDIDLRLDAKGDWIEEEYTTRAAILEREAHKHPIIGKLLEYRRMSKRWSNYVDQLAERLVERGGRYFVHGSFHTDRVETFRLSSSKPNLQNIPRNFETDELSPEDVAELMAMNIKNQFVSRWDDGWFLEADESQLEIRVAAWMSGDKKLLAAITMGQDIHRAVASVLLNKSPELVTKDERQRCKTLNFLILYGGGARRLSAQLGCSKEQAKEYIQWYFEGFPELARWIARVKERVKLDLCVTTPFGFKRFFDKPYRWDSPAGWRIERMAVNTLIQSPAATIVQLAMVQAEQVMRDEKLKSLMVSQVHDSVAIDTRPDEVRQVSEIIRHSLENPDLSGFDVNLSVPLVADIEIGRDWGHKAPIEKVINW